MDDKISSKSAKREQEEDFLQRQENHLAIGLVMFILACGLALFIRWLYRACKSKTTESITHDLWVAAELRQSLESVSTKTSQQNSMKCNWSQKSLSRQHSAETLQTDRKRSKQTGSASPTTICPESSIIDNNRSDKSIKMFDAENRQHPFPVRGSFGNFGVHTQGLTVILEDQLDSSDTSENTNNFDCAIFEENKENEETEVIIS